MSIEVEDKYNMNGKEELQDEWRVGGEDEEEWKEVVKTNMNYKMYCVLRMKSIE